MLAEKPAAVVVYGDTNSTLAGALAGLGLGLAVSLVLVHVVYGIGFTTLYFRNYYAAFPTELVRAAQIDGANRWQQLRYVVIPHLMPLVIFISLIQLMDNFRVFEPIVGFSAQANATSLSFIIFNDLRGDVMRFNSAAATSVLTILGVTILLLPVLIRTWRDFKGKLI